MQYDNETIRYCLKAYQAAQRGTPEQKAVADKWLVQNGPGIINGLVERLEGERHE